MPQASTATTTSEAKGTFKVAAGTKVVVLVSRPGHKAANVRFAVK